MGTEEGTGQVATSPVALVGDLTGEPSVVMVAPIMFDGFKVTEGETSAEEVLLLTLLTWQHHFYPHSIGLDDG